MDAMQILVVILSVFLAIFLVLAIILLVQLIRITRQIQAITETTQTAVERVSSFFSAAGKIVSPAIIAQVVADFVKKSKNKKDKED